MLVVALLLIWFGWKNAVLDLGSFRMPSLIPLTVYTAIVPVAGVLIALFTIEQLVNGWQHGFEGPEDRDNHRRDSSSVSGSAPHEPMRRHPDA